MAHLPGYRRVRVRLFLAAGLLGQAALGDPAPPRAPPPACEHCHTIPYQKGVCCSNVGVRTECPKCHAMVWPREKDACCGGGRRVLDEGYNPPLRPEYKVLLQSPHVSFNSRILNSALALGSQGTFPSREHGGLGMYDEGLAFLHLMGKACALSTCARRVHCLCAQGALSMCAGGTVHVRREHRLCARGALSMCAGCTFHVHRGICPRRMHCPCAQGELST